ncbi:MAG TPA: TIM barrel protein [Candidatus Poseidoniales archaeon]|nr:TIM barrel protein [Candidatus Poseidoniales archaeon]
MRFGPAGVPLSCKGRTIVDGMDDITSLGLDTMEIQTVRAITPQHFDQYWQAGLLSWKTEFEMNIHGPYYAEILGNRRARMRTMAKLEASLQAGKVLNAHHITCHVGPYGELGRGKAANEMVASVFSGVVERVNQIWKEDIDLEVFPWLEEREPMKIGIETSGRQNLWGSIEEVIEVVNHVPGTVPVLNFGHIHARGHGRLRTSEDYAELFDQVREGIGTKEFYCHFSGVEHRMGDAMHYTQIRRSDLNFEPLAEYLVDEGDWLDVTLIADSPLLEHDGMYMYLQVERLRHRNLEKQVREERQRALAAGIIDQQEEEKEEKASEEEKASNEEEEGVPTEEEKEEQEEKVAEADDAETPETPDDPTKGDYEHVASEDEDLF